MISLASCNKDTHTLACCKIRTLLSLFSISACLVYWSRNPPPRTIFHQFRYCIFRCTSCKRLIVSRLSGFLMSENICIILSSKTGELVRVSDSGNRQVSESCPQFATPSSPGRFIHAPIPFIIKRPKRYSPMITIELFCESTVSKPHNISRNMGGPYR